MITRLIFLLLVLLTQVTFSQKQNLSFTITCLQPYCGGARPSEEMEAEFQKPKAYSKKTIVLVSENGKKLCVKTSESGVIQVKLNSGTYKLYEFWRIKKQSPEGSDLKKFDKDCLASEWKKEFAVITVDSKGGTLKETNGIVIPCYFNIPCLLDAFRPSIPE